MNDFCCVKYINSTKKKVIALDYDNLRIIECYASGNPGFLSRFKIRRYCGDLLTYDKLAIAKNLFNARNKKLFSSCIDKCVEKYCSSYGLNPYEMEIAIAGNIGFDQISRLSDLFKMVWVSGTPFDTDSYNVYFTSDYNNFKKADILICSDDNCSISCPVVFNLTEKAIPGAYYNVEIDAGQYNLVDKEIRNEVVFEFGIPYVITNLVK